MITIRLRPMTAEAAASCGSDMRPQGFTSTGLVEDEHEGVVVTAMRWEQTT